MPANITEYGAAYVNLFPDVTAITPSDTLNIDGSGIAVSSAKFFTIYVGGAGNIVGVTSLGKSITVLAPAVGLVLPILFKQVNATGTTATGLLGLR